MSIKMLHCTATIHLLKWCIIWLVQIYWKSCLIRTCVKLVGIRTCVKLVGIRMCVKLVGSSRNRKGKWHVVQKPKLCSYKWACLTLILCVHGKFWACKWQFYNFHVIHNLWITGFSSFTIFLIIPLSDTPIRILPVNKTNFEMLNKFN